MRLILPLLAVLIFGTASLTFASWLARDQRHSAALTQTRQGQTSTRPPATRLPTQSAASVTFTHREIATYDEILRRPIFFQDRSYPKPTPKPKPKPVQTEVSKPQQSPPKARAEPPKPPPKFAGSLHGIMINGDLRKALLSVDKRSPKWIGLDEAFNGWIVIAVEPNSVSLRQSSSTTIVKLHASTR